MDLHFEQDGHGDEGDDGSQDGPLEALQHGHQQHQEREDDAIVLGHFRRSRWQKASLRNLFDSFQRSFVQPERNRRK